MEKVDINLVKRNPGNPRTIKDDNFAKLVQSLRDFPEMADVREIVVNKDYVILGGNMRYQAMKEAGWDQVAVKVVDWPEEKQREFMIKDNVAAGDWDWERLANEWDAAELVEWGMDEGELKVNANLSSIDDITADWESMDVMAVNPPEAPRLKERFELNFEGMEKYQKFKEKYEGSPDKLIKDLEDSEIL